MLLDVDSSLQLLLADKFPTSDNYRIGEAIDSTIGPRLAGKGSTFNYRPVEILFSEIAGLLERCLAAHNMKQELEVKSFDFWLDQSLNEKRLDVRDRQIAAGELSLPVRTAILERELHDAALGFAHQQIASNSASLTSRQPNDQQYVGRVDQTAQVAVLSAYSGQAALDAASRELSATVIGQEAQSARSALSASELTAVIHEKNAEVAAAKGSFERANEDLRHEQHLAEKAFYASRRSLGETDGSSYNFKQRLDDLQSMFEIDFEAAYTRAVAAAEGLDKVFCLSAALPDIAHGRPVALLTLWLRKAIESLSECIDAQISQDIQISLRQVLDANSWRELLSGQDVVLKIDKALFPGGHLIRIASIDALVISTRQDEQWALRYRPPSQATVIAPDESEKTMDQSDVGPILLGYCSNPTITSSISTLGSQRKLLNLSPIGDWRIQVAGNSTCGSRPQSITDIVVNLSTRQV